ncbi:Protein multipolar spindle 1 [Vitis vinifera]|uniref:Protein multipolar spindle 1 n=1 Tax=Vitis vinifera TaxID=29760 RepID=A0A438IHF3_VITVI|nr:Protein multipolar spindle 1 [Vitis vinifera]
MSTSNTDSHQSLKLAIAMALLRSKLLHNTNPPPPHSDALRWKRKAKERKQELLRLKEDLREAEDGLRHDLFPPSASCKCHFFDDLGKLSPNQFERGSNRNFNDVLRRRFLRQVRLKERRRKRTDDSIKHNHYSDIVCEDETEQLRASIDFLVELCDTASPVENSNFTNWSHQAVDFILGHMPLLAFLVYHCNQKPQYYPEICTWKKLIVE